MVIKLPRSRESTPVAVTPPSTSLASLIGISLWVWAMLVVLVVYDYVYENVNMFTFPGGTPRGAHTERTAGGCPVKSVCPLHS